MNLILRTLQWSYPRTLVDSNPSQIDCITQVYSIENYGNMSVFLRWKITHS